MSLHGAIPSQFYSGVIKDGRSGESRFHRGIIINLRILERRAREACHQFLFQT